MQTDKIIESNYSTLKLLEGTKEVKLENIQNHPLKNPVTIISSDRKVFVIDERLAVYSKTIKSLLNPKFNYKPNNERVINLPIQSKWIGKCLEFMKLKYNDVKDFKIKEAEATELLEVACYLQL